MKLLKVCLALMPLLFAPATSQAALFTFSMSLTGPGESPPNGSPGTGAGTVSFDTVAHTMAIALAGFGGLLGTTTAAHIHAATAVPFTGTAGVATTTPSFAGFPLGVTAGSFSSTLDMTLASSYNPSYITANGGTPASAETALLTASLAGEAYFNIHTSAFPGGEIRGFLTPTPEPGSVTLIGLGCAWMLAQRRRQR